MSAHKHREEPRCAADAEMLDNSGASECLYICVGIHEGQVVGVNMCAEMSREAAVDVVSQVLTVITDPAETGRERSGH